MPLFVSTKPSPYERWIALCVSIYAVWQRHRRCCRSANVHRKYMLIIIRTKTNRMDFVNYAQDSQTQTESSQHICDAMVVHHCAACHPPTVVHPFHSTGFLVANGYMGWAYTASPNPPSSFLRNERAPEPNEAKPSEHTISIADTVSVILNLYFYLNTNM